MFAASLPHSVTGAAPSTSNRTVLEVLTKNSSEATRVEAQVLERGGAVLGRAPGVLLVELPERAASRLTESVGQIDGVLRPPVVVDARPQRANSTAVPEQFGPTTGGADVATNATAWHSNGITGTGVRVGVIDFFDVTKYWNTAEHGPLPVSGVTAKCFEFGRECTGDFFDGNDLGGEDHGVAVVEVIRDMAPGAEVFIGQATTATDYQALVDWFVSKGVSVINRSLGSRYDGPGDGRGILDDIAAGATARGITWINSGGNNGANRYYRQAVRLVGNRVAFGPSGNDTYLRMRGCTQLGGIRWANDWDVSPSQRTDYDVYLWDSPTGDPTAGSVVASSLLPQQSGAPPLEFISDDHCPATGHSLYLEVRWVGGDIAGDVLEISDYGSGIALYTQAAYSAAVPVVDSDDPGVIAVGAIDPPDGTAIASYSSQGPTNDGRIAPDVAAVSRLPSVAFGGVFAGTSASAAVVTGGAALLVDADLAVPGHALAELIRHVAVDRGSAGPDNLYGHGQFILPAPPSAGVDSRPSTFVALDVPTRVLDTRPASAVGPSELIGTVARGEILDLPIVQRAGLPAGEATAVAVNIVSVGPDRRSHVQALPTFAATLGGYSNLNVDQPGQTRANFAIVPIGRDGSISLTSIATGNIVVDLLGWFRATPTSAAAGRFVELPAAQRVLDSRSIPPVAPLRSGEVRAVPMPSGVDPALVSALVVTVTATRTTGPGWVQAVPAGRPDAIGATSTLNITAGDTVANAAIVPVGSGSGIALTAFFIDGGRGDVIVDVTGYITSVNAPTSTSGRYVAVRPGRAFDSRLGFGALGDGTVVTVAAGPVGVPTSASGVVWNMTIAAAQRAGHVTGWAANAPQPATSLLNWRAPGSTRAASAITAVDSGRAKFRTEDGPVNAPGPLGHLVADVFGYFT